MTSNESPTEYSYWVVPGKLLAGQYPLTEADVKSLEAAGIASFIDLTEEGRHRPYRSHLENAERRRFPIRNYSIPDSPGATTAILDAIDENIENDKPTYVHCRGGFGRTGTVIGCWLSRQGFEGSVALRELARLRSRNIRLLGTPSPETEEQKQYVRDWTASA